MNSPVYFKAVFFDLGGTLFHHLPVSHTRNNLISTIRASGVPEGVTDTAIMETYAWERENAERRRLDQRFYLHREIVATAYRRTQETLHVSDVRAVATFCAQQKDVVLQHLQLRADTLTTLALLKQRNIYTAIVSNIDDEYIVPLLARTGLASETDAWLSSERARSCKPDIAIFDQASARAGVAPAHTLFVGDSVAHDVDGANRAGMASVLLTADHAEPDTATAAHTIANLTDVVDLLD